MNHSFDMDIATKYGVNEAIFLQNVAFWTHLNIANQKNFHDGRYWTFNSIEAYTALFPYWTTRQLRVIIDSCISAGLLLKGKYSKLKYDKTSWYSISDEGLLLFPSISSTARIDPHLSELTNGFVRIDKPITDNLTDTIKDIVTDVPSPSIPPQFEELKPYIELWNEHAVAVGCPPMGQNKRQLSSIKKSFKEIKKQWDRKVTPKNFEVWLDDAIFHEFYMMCKFKNRMDVCVRPEHFLNAYNHVMEASPR